MEIIMYTVVYVLLIALIAELTRQVIKTKNHADKLEIKIRTLQQQQTDPSTVDQRTENTLSEEHANCTAEPTLPVIPKFPPDRVQRWGC